MDADNQTNEHAPLYPNVVKAVNETTWAILPERLQTIVDIVEHRAAGLRYTPEEIRAHLGDDRRPREETMSIVPAPEAAAGDRQATAGAVAVIPIMGTILPRATLFSEFSGGASVTRIQRELRQAVADPDIGSILLNIDSPGGSTDLIPELGAEIAAARAKKPIVAIANTSAYSAAYWLASQADELIVTPSGGVGSVGVLWAHVDVSGFEEKIGRRTTLVHAGDRKVELYPYAPLSDSGRAQMQETVDEFYGMFVKAVARGRGVSTKVVEDTYGQGATITASKAVKAGMADRIDTIENTIARMQRGKITRRATAEVSVVVDASAAAAAMLNLAAAASRNSAGTIVVLDAEARSVLGLPPLVAEADDDIQNHEPAEPVLVEGAERLLSRGAVRAAYGPVIEP